jgi:hypothetical protein
MRFAAGLLQAFKAQGGRVQLPIGMTTAEPWLLDAVDVPALLSGLHQCRGSGTTVDLLLYCRKGSNSRWDVYMVFTCFVVQYAALAGSILSPATSCAKNLWSIRLAF